MVHLFTSRKYAIPFILWHDEHIVEDEQLEQAGLHLKHIIKVESAYSSELQAVEH
jgi:hypothetical protein